jgi:hypothetical protein
VFDILSKPNIIVNLNIRKFIVGKMSELALDIEEALCAGYSFDDIATQYGVSIKDVMTINENMIESIYDDENIDILLRDAELDDGLEDYDDYMDGDFDSAMKSAGYGTDEDYDYYGADY